MDAVDRIEHWGAGAGFESLFEERCWVIIRRGANEAYIVRVGSFVTGVG